MRANLSEIVRSLRKRGIEVLLIGLGNLDLAQIAHTNSVPYVQWTLPLGKYRARDSAHFNAEGYSIVTVRMLPQVEEMIARVIQRRPWRLRELQHPRKVACAFALRHRAYLACALKKLIGQSQVNALHPLWG